VLEQCEGLAGEAADVGGESSRLVVGQDAPAHLAEQAAGVEQEAAEGP
jgi:hypothetical protein